MTPLAAVVAGLLAGAAGTVCLDAVHYLKYRRAGGTDSLLAWEFAPVESWETAPDPGQVAKRVLEGFTQRKLPDRSAWLTSTIAHRAYGSAAGVHDHDVRRGGAGHASASASWNATHSSSGTSLITSTSGRGNWRALRRASPGG